MIITVRLFARAKDLAGTDALGVELTEGETVGGLRRALAALQPSLTGLLQRSAIAVDGDFASDSVVLGAKAEVAVLPPVSGG